MAELDDDERAELESKIEELTRRYRDLKKEQNAVNKKK
jgi:hypothetical protein